MISMGRAHLIKGVRLPQGKQTVSLNLTRGHVLTYLKRFPIDHFQKKLTAKHQHECRGPIMENSQRHWEHWNASSSLWRVNFPVVSESCDKRIIPGVSWFCSITVSCSWCSHQWFSTEEHRCTSPPTFWSRLLGPVKWQSIMEFSHDNHWKADFSFWITSNHAGVLEPSKFHYDVSLMLRPTLLFRLW